MSEETPVSNEKAPENTSVPEVNASEAPPEETKEEDSPKGPPFVHLHLHTSYSLLDGGIRIGDLMEHCKKHGMNAVALTDHGQLFGAVEFFKKAKKAGIKPLIGVETYIAPSGRSSRIHKEKNYHLVLLAKNLEGYRNLCRLVSFANIEGFYKKPRIDHELLEKHKEGLIVTSACRAGEIPQLILRNEYEAAKKAALWHKELFGEDYYLEIQRDGTREQEIANEGVIRLAKELDIDLIATCDAHFLTEEDHQAHQALLALGQGKLLGDPGMGEAYTTGHHVRSPERMWQDFGDIPEALENTVKIAEKIDCEIPLGENFLPHFPVPEGMDEAGYFEQLAREGLKERIAELPYEVDEEAYLKRLEYEIGVILKMDFPGYFLIVQDFIIYAKKNGIPVGPGRGSGAGSMVAYALRITDLDPIHHGLIFERFLNPERISMPDFDVDFCMNRREEVIRYVTEKYGADNVAQIVTYGTLKARGVVRDVCRVMDIKVAEADTIAKMIPSMPPNLTLSKAVADEPKLRETCESNPKYSEMLQTALKLEGLHRHTGLHAAGVVISEMPLWEYCPIFRDRSTGQYVSQFAKSEVEAAGLVKFDFLGLKTLTVIDEAMKLVNRDREDPIDIEKLTLDDPKVYSLISTGDTNGIFQMESGGFQQMLRTLKPDRFEDIVAAVALYRPGPMKIIPTFVARKHGREEIKLVDPILEPILRETYGLIVYQEQVMQIGVQMAGFTMGKADKLRKAMGKKKAELMAELLDDFVSGAVEKGFDKTVVERVKNEMVDFAQYGFNKSHAAAYAVISYRTAWLKTYYPLEFLAATLTCDMESTEKVVKFIHETKQMGIPVRPPCVNNSRLEFTVEDGGIRFGLGAIKGLGKGAIESMIEERNTRPFDNLYDFCDRIDSQKLNKRGIEAMVYAGAFDFEGVERHRLLAAVPKAVEAAQQKQRDRETGQVSLFDAFAGSGGEAMAALTNYEYPEVPPWTEKERLQAEKASLGLFLSAHPMDRYTVQARRYTKLTLETVHRMADQEMVTVIGIMSELKDKPTKNGKGRFAIFKLEDPVGSIDCLMFGRVYEDYSENLLADEPLVVTGKMIVEQTEDSVRRKIRVDRLQQLAKIVERKTRRIHLSLSPGTDRTLLQELKGLFEENPGDVPVSMHCAEPGRFDAEVKLPVTTWSIGLTDELLNRLESILGKDTVMLV